MEEQAHDMEYSEAINLAANYEVEWIDYTLAGFQEVFDNGRIKKHSNI